MVELALVLMVLELVLVLMVVVVFSGVDPKQGCEGLILSFLAPLLYQSLFWPFANLAFPGVSSAEKRWFEFLLNRRTVRQQLVRGATLGSLNSWFSW